MSHEALIEEMVKEIDYLLSFRLIMGRRRQLLQAIKSVVPKLPEPLLDEISKQLTVVRSEMEPLEQAPARTVYNGCPWGINIGGKWYSCIHSDGMVAHIHQYYGPDGLRHDAPESDPAPGW